MMKISLECLGVYGGRANERVECRGRTGGSSVCPCGLSHMDKLRVILMPPRSSVLLLDGATSTYILRGDSERMLLRRARWCLGWWWSYPSSEDDVHGLFHCALLHKFTKNSPGGFLPVEKMHKNVYGKTRIVTNFRGFLEKEVRHGFFWVVREVSGLWTWEHKFENEREAYLRKMHNGGQIKGQADRTRPADLGSLLPQLP
jgi:hypothetical protein